MGHSKDAVRFLQELFYRDELDADKEWNKWRKKNPDAKLDLRNLEIYHEDDCLSGFNLRGADLRKVGLHMQYLPGTDLTDANLRGAEMWSANISGVKLRRASLRAADLSGAILSGADLRNADLSKANLQRASLTDADLRHANLELADLTLADLTSADLSGARLRAAKLRGTTLDRTNVNKADLSGAYVYGVSVWDVDLKGAKQNDLVITPPDEPVVTVDNLQVAQFIFLLLNNENVRMVLDAVTSKVVLILGRFSARRKRVLDALREELRHRGLTPVLFDFVKPASKDLTGTVETLARMAKFVIADLTEPRCIPHELATIVPFLRTTPVVPLKLVGADSYGMFEDLMAYSWVLDIHEYKNTKSLIAGLPSIIAPAEKMADALRKPP